MTKERDKITQRAIRDSCTAFSKRSHQVHDAVGGYIELYVILTPI